MVLGVSPKEWALHMMHEETELDTLALIAIRNMLEVSIIYMCTFFVCCTICAIRQVVLSSDDFDECALSERTQFSSFLNCYVICKINRFQCVW